MGKRILVVDDDPVIREIINVMLQSLGYEVTLAEDGSSALRVLDSGGPASEFSLIFLDRQMPGMNGLELLTEIKKRPHTQNTPAIMLTAEDKPEDIMAGYSVGADYYITKPFTREQLVYGIDLVLG